MEKRDATMTPSITTTTADPGTAPSPEEADRIRREVAEHYTRAVTAGACCGEGGTSATEALQAGYAPEALETLPADAVQNAFGCGDPVAFSDLVSGETVLDLGSGAGIDLMLAAQKVGPEGRVIGLDMTDEMIRRARANVEAAGLTNVEVVQGLIEDIPLPDASVDVIISNCVINLSPDKPRVFAEMARVLRPGGRIRVSDMVAEDLPEWARRIADLYASCISGAISETEYLAGLEAAGLKHAAVLARLDYDEAQLRAMVGGLTGEGVCCGGAAPDSATQHTATEQAGKASSCCGPAVDDALPSRSALSWSGRGADSAEAEPAAEAGTDALAAWREGRFSGRVASILVSARKPAA